MRFYIPISLDKKLVFLVMVVSVVSLTIIALQSFNFSEEILEKRISDQLISESAIRGNAIKALFDTRTKETQLLSTNPTIQNLVDELNHLQYAPELESKIKENRLHFVTEVKAFRELVGYSIGFVDTKIIGKQGKIFFSLGKIDGRDFSQDPRFIHGLNEPFVELEPTSIGERKMIVVTPIFEREVINSSEPIGVIIAEMSTVELDKILLTRSGLGETGEVYLVNHDYLMISESRFIKNAAFNRSVDTIPVRKCFEQDDDFGGLYKDYRGNSIFGFSYCARDLGFVLLAEIGEAEMFQPVMILRDKIFVTSIFITVGMAIATFFLSKLVSRPIIKLKNAVNEIAQGNFDIRTNIKTSDEIGQLSLAFDSMARKIQESLLAIKQRESVIKQQQNVLLQFSDQSQNYFVCFLDVIESTKITAKLSDLDSGKFYSIFLNSMANKIESFDGIVVKNIGDALLFYFPRTNSQDERELKNALECCLSIGEFNKEINKKMEGEGLPSLSYKISATYGSVRVAKIATSSIEDIFGSTVNKCAKINRLAPPNGVVIGKALYQITKNFNDYVFNKINNEAVTKEYEDVFHVTRR